MRMRMKQFSLMRAREKVGRSCIEWAIRAIRWAFMPLIHSSIEKS